MKPIHYNELVQEYHAGINNILRGFKPQYEFLEMWVPDSDDSKSILNLFDAAKIAGEDKVSLFVDKNSIDGMDFSAFTDEAKKLGQLDSKKSEGGFILELRYEEISRKQDSKKTNKPMTVDNFYPLYREKLKNFLGVSRYEGSVAGGDNGGVLIRSSKDGVSLFAEVDTANHRIKRVSYAGVTNEVHRSLMECLCQIIEGKPIQEVSDHGVMRLEFSLRDFNQPRLVPGIITVFNMPEEFQWLNELTHDLLKMYRKNSTYEKTANFYDPPAGEKWRSLAAPERQTYLQEQINKLLASMAIRDVIVRVTDIAKGVKAYILLEGDINASAKPVFMRDLEAAVHRHIDARIELYMEEIKDKNDKREIQKELPGSK